MGLPAVVLGDRGDGSGTGRPFPAAAAAAFTSMDSWPWEGVEPCAFIDTRQGPGVSTWTVEKDGKATRTSAPESVSPES
jgi:hypothetical protein